MASSLPIPTQQQQQEEEEEEDEYLSTSTITDIKSPSVPMNFEDSEDIYITNADESSVSMNFEDTIDIHADKNDYLLLEEKLHNIKLHNNNSNNGIINYEYQNDTNNNNNNMQILINEVKELRKTLEMTEDHIKLSIQKMNVSLNRTIIDTITTDTDDFYHSYRKKIKFDNNEKYKKIQENCYIVQNCKVNNFGKIVGKFGNTIKRLQKTYDIMIIVPDESNNETFPYIVVCGHKNYNCEEACKEIVRILSF